MDDIPHKQNPSSFESAAELQSSPGCMVQTWHQHAILFLSKSCGKGVD